MFAEIRMVLREHINYTRHTTLYYKRRCVSLGVRAQQAGKCFIFNVCGLRAIKNRGRGKNGFYQSTYTPLHLLCTCIFSCFRIRAGVTRGNLSSHVLTRSGVSLCWALRNLENKCVYLGSLKFAAPRNRRRRRARSMFYVLNFASTSLERH